MYYIQCTGTRWKSKRGRDKEKYKETVKVAKSERSKRQIERDRLTVMMSRMLSRLWTLSPGRTSFTTASVPSWEGTQTKTIILLLLWVWIVVNVFHHWNLSTTTYLWTITNRTSLDSTDKVEQNTKSQFHKHISAPASTKLDGYKEGNCGLLDSLLQMGVQ